MHDPTRIDLLFTMSEITQVDALVRAVDCGTMFSRTMWLRFDEAARLRSSSFAGHASHRLGCATRSLKGEAWWSQTGSNRRPHACKARALPAELWPRNPEDECFTRRSRHEVLSAPLRSSGASPGTLRIFPCMAYATLSFAWLRHAEPKAKRGGPGKT